MKRKIIPTRNEIWYVDLDPTKGREQAKKRPCLVVSANTYNAGPYQLVVIVPLTSKYHPFSWFVELKPEHSGLSKTSYVITNQIRTVSLERFIGKPIGSIDSTYMSAIEFRLRALLAL